MTLYRYVLMLFLILFLSNTNFVLQQAKAQGEDCCCWGDNAMMIMGADPFMCWDNGLPDPECGWCTLGYRGTSYSFACRQDNTCEEYEEECGGLVLVLDKIYSGVWNCEFCFCDEPPSSPLRRREYTLCCEDTCQGAGEDCNCEPPYGS